MAGIVKLAHVLGANSEGHFHTLAKKAPFDLGLQHQVSAVADDDQFWNRTTVAVAAFPGDLVVLVSVQQTALFVVLTAVIVAVEVATRDWFVHGLGQFCQYGGPS